MSEENYYELLDVPPDATADEIREAFHTRHKELQWAASNLLDRERQYEAQRMVDKLGDAYETLSDPARRTSYDETLRQAKRHARRRPASPTPSPADQVPNWPCPECNEVNPRGSKACTQCGAALTKTCPECRRSMYVADRFCGECASNYEEARARFEKVAVQAAMEAEEAAQVAQQAWARRDVEAVKRAADQAEAAAGRAQDAAGRAGTERARDAARTAGGAARSAGEVVQQAEVLLEEQAKRRQRVLGMLKLAGWGALIVVLVFAVSVIVARDWLVDHEVLWFKDPQEREGAALSVTHYYSAVAFRWWMGRLIWMSQQVPTDGSINNPDNWKKIGFRERDLTEWAEVEPQAFSLMMTPEGRRQLLSWGEEAGSRRPVEVTFEKMENVLGPGSYSEEDMRRYLLTPKEAGGAGWTEDDLLVHTVLMTTYAVKDPEKVRQLTNGWTLGEVLNEYNKAGYLNGVAGSEGLENFNQDGLDLVPLGE